MIRGLTDRRHFTRAGRIRIGEKLPTARGGTRPARLDYFKFIPDDPTEAARFAALYGDRPARLRVCFLSDELEHTFPQAYRCYGGDTLLCKGDGATARRTLPKADPEIVKCPGPWACTFALERGADDRPGCKAVGSLFVALPEMGHLRVYQLDTGSRESVIRLNTGLDLLRRLAGGLALIPVDLVLAPAQTRTADGRPVEFHALDLVIPSKPARLTVAGDLSTTGTATAPPLRGVVEIDPEALDTLDPAGDAPGADDADLDAGDLEGARVDPDTGEINPGDDGCGLDDDPLVLSTAEAAGVGPRALRAMLEAAQRHGWTRGRLLEALRERGARHGPAKKSEAPQWRSWRAPNAEVCE